MTQLYPPIEPYDHGMLEVGDGHLVYWEVCGNPRGRPTVVLHGGPGSGCTTWHRQLFDPDAYQIVLFDQRNCGRSRPHASAAGVELGTNTTAHLIADIERLRTHLAIDRWMVFGGSWGSTLALAYAEQFPHRVSEMILFGVTTGRRREFDWWFRGGAAILFPEQWQRLRSAVGASEHDDLIEGYCRHLNDRDPDVCRQAATAWCTWESAGAQWPPGDELSPRYRDPAFALAFARIVTHYVSHDGWLADGAILNGIGALSGIPAIMVNGRFDFQAPIGWAWELHRQWQGSRLVIVDAAGHDGSHTKLTRELIHATDEFARQRG